MSTTELNARRELRRLTALSEKADYYSQETYFRESWREISRVYGDQTHRFVIDHALVLLKPEAVVTRKVADCLGYFAQVGFEPVAARCIHFTRHHTRSLWRYKLNIATLDRLDVVDLFQSATPSIVILVKDAESPSYVPASVRLTQMKGRSDPRLRRPSDLRARLGVQNRIISFLHSADEPADLVRELGILFERSEIAELLDEARTNTPVAASEITRDLYADWPAHDLELGGALRRVAGSADTLAAQARSRREQSHMVRLSELCEVIQPSSICEWHELVSLVEPVRSAFDPLDLATIGANVVRPDSPQGARMLGDVDCDSWLAPRRESMPRPSRGQAPSPDCETE